MDKRNALIGLLVVNQLAMSIAGRVIVKAYEKEKRKYKRLYEMTGYLLHICEEKGIDLSEFDLIALNDLTKDNLEE